MRRTEERRVGRSAQLGPRRAALGQFFTPQKAAELITAMFELPSEGMIRVLDPGAGVGSLTAALVSRFAEEAPEVKLSLTAVEIDGALKPDLDATLGEAAQVHPGLYETVSSDFVPWAADQLATVDRFDLVVMNPPYRKIAKGSPEQLALARAGVATTNLYTGFVTLALRLLAPGGQLVAITPRSFTNGTYFKTFRQELLQRTSIQRIHVFDGRNTVFKDAQVLQENIIFTLREGTPPGSVVITSSPGYTGPLSQHEVPHNAVVNDSDPQSFIRIATDVGGLDVSAQMAAMPRHMNDTGLEVMTGRVVDFRADDLRPVWHEGDAPLVYPGHLTARGCRWPRGAPRKPSAIANQASSRLLLVPRGHYVAVKRFSAKEEPRRVVACHVSPDDLPGDWWAFENHLNVFHIAEAGLPEAVAEELTTYLNSDLVDDFVRLFNGHTQINAGDLRSLRYPDFENAV